MPATHATTGFRTASLRQSLIGLSLAGGVFAGWLAIHLYGMFVFDLTWITLPVALAMAAVQCWLSVGLFIVSHDAMHGSLVPRGTTVNGIIGGSLLFLYAGFGWRKMKRAHFSHHEAPGTPNDPDFSAEHPNRFWPWYTTFLMRYFGWRSAIFVSTVVTVYWAVFGVPVEKIVLLYGLPAIASSMQLFYFGTYRPHRHDEMAFADRHNARSERFGSLVSLATCFHFGYHREHHCAPHVPRWSLPATRREMARTETNA